MKEIDFLLEAGPQVFTPETPGEVISDIAFSQAPSVRKFKEELVKGAQAQQALRILRQEKINEAHKRIQWRAIDGIGERIASIDPEIYFQQMQLHGEDCWGDREFIASFLRDNPDCRIKSEYAPRVMVTTPVPWKAAGNAEEPGILTTDYADDTDKAGAEISEGENVERPTSNVERRMAATTEAAR